MKKCLTFLTEWFKILKEKLKMSRPRKVKFGNGEILLCNYSPEEADAIQATLLASAKNLIESPQVGDIVDLSKKDEVLEVIDQTTLSETALDLYMDPKTNLYSVVHVKYNPVSKSAKVVEFIPAGSFRLAGTNSLKMEMVKLGKV